MTILLKRAYEKPSTKDGKRILVERLWPRGLKKEEAKIHEWLKEIAPSAELRKWYNHDPKKWTEFKKRYWAELEAKKDLVLKIVQESQNGIVTFVFSSKEETLNNANALKEYIETKLINNPKNLATSKSSEKMDWKKEEVILTKNEITESLKKLQGWRLNSTAIEKNFKFDSFEQAIKFINKVAYLASNENHHPDIALENQ